MSTEAPEFPPIQPLIPREPVPSLSLDRVGGDRWTLSDAEPERFTLLVFYRGLHCPLCRTYLQQLVKLLDGLTSIGVEEPHRFSEPALYLVRPDGSLYFGVVQTMPFARPDFPSILSSVNRIIENDYPGRGEIR